MCFLNRLEAAVPAGKLVHAILDNYAVHKHPKVRACLAPHPRWVFHFTPTSCSWANAVEGFFATLPRRRLQRGVFHLLVDLQAAINRYLGEQPQTHTFRLDRRPRPHHREGQSWASLHRVRPLVLAAHRQRFCMIRLRKLIIKAARAEAPVMSRRSIGSRDGCLI
jgi:DDE superfamily endonuclease